jgi:hypothetical protein
MIGGRQEIGLNRSGFYTYGTVLHEIGHAVGLIHEHSRTDRDRHIIINWDNIKESWKYAFEIDKRTIYRGDFDFEVDNDLSMLCFL